MDPWVAGVVVGLQFIVIIVIAYFLFRNGVPTWEEFFRQLHSLGRPKSGNDEDDKDAKG